MPTPHLRTPFAATALAVTALAAASLVAVPVSAAADQVQSPLLGDAEILTVNYADLDGGIDVNFTVPHCVTEIAYVMDGAEGGSSRTPGTNDYAAGGLGSVLSGTLAVTGGQVLSLRPSSAGGNAQFDSDLGGGGAAGLGLRTGGVGMGSATANDGRWPHAGGGGGGASGIRINNRDAAIAGGGGGAGGNGNTDTQNTGYGGTNGEAGGDGTNYADSGGLGGVTESGAGGWGPVVSEFHGGGGGGGGGGLHGGAGGWSTGRAHYGGGGGGAGSSAAIAEYASGGDIADFGLSESDADPTGDGSITIAWYSCATELTVSGTATSTAGAVAPAAGWSQSVSATGSATPGTGILDSEGSFTTTIDRFTATGTQTVTVTQEERDGWLMQNWSEDSLDVPLAVCTVDGDAEQSLTVTNLSASSYRVDVPWQSEVTCTANTVEAAPKLLVLSNAQDLETGGYNPAAVNSGDRVEFYYSIVNTGNIPLSIAASDTGVDLSCGNRELRPGGGLTCRGTVPVTSNQ